MKPWLRLALLFTFLAHGTAMLGMAILLLPAMPGGGTTSDAERVAWIASHVGTFRLGWLPWHVTAASDLVLAILLTRIPKIPPTLRWAQLALTFVAVLCDQGGQVLWLTRVVAQARAGDVAGYLATEHVAFPLTGWYAALLYTLGAIAWTLCFRAAGVWSKTIARVSIPLWMVFLIATIGPLLPEGFRVPDRAVAAANAIGFIMMELWFLLLFRAAREAPGVT
ncbi:hypothetical protein BH09MYX1_BH09MYX1_42020 [soil metagenome]